MRALSGAAPAALDGTLYRVGPGRFEDAEGAFAHWFDGEGLLTAVRFCAGGVEVANRLIRPAGWDRRSYARRGRMGRAPRGLLRRLAGLVAPSTYVNVANTALMAWQGRLFALFEAGLPTEVDPKTLETLGETDLGAIRRTLGAHPHRHVPTGDLIGQGFVPPPRPAIDFYAFPQQGDVRRFRRVPVSNRFPAHDLAVTEHAAITILSPLLVDVPALLSGKPIVRCLEWRPELGSEVVVAPFGTGENARLTASPMLYSHTANAFEDGSVYVVQGVAAEDASLADWTGRVRRGAASLAPLPSPGRLTELRLDVPSGDVRAETLFETPMEFPTIDPRWTGRRHRVVFGVGYADDAEAYSDFYDALLRFDLDRGVVEKLAFGRHQVISEPVFVPHGPGEGDGWLLLIAYDAAADESHVVVIEAGSEMRISGRWLMPDALPMSLHGLWVDGREALGR